MDSRNQSSQYSGYVGLLTSQQQYVVQEYLLSVRNNLRLHPNLMPHSGVTEEMRLDYSYTPPSESEDYGENSADSGYSETEFDIMLDQAEIDAARVVYPPQPEVEFGFPKECYCGGQPVVETSYTRTDPGRSIVKTYVSVV
ncbi:hypothetical protein Bca52824_087594 [Brassica carinata]|uniref:Uncharacterized protein n=1 Tax=Brassica carinata TaxID=52824 RepID=A0A8X7TNS9_BRACI|nr:hypothetical protein Bca52824_087594 [Brassica carinata]